MLTTLKDILQIAEEKKIAIGAFNAPNIESLLAILSASEELALPVILQFAQCHEELLSLDIIGPLMISMAVRAKTPICVHLDHGETLEYIDKALAMGFTSVMYDGSSLPYEENVENTIKAVAMAAKTGASVEAELGSMGKRESGTGTKDSGAPSDKIYTDPKQAKRFVQQTGIDALACSFGTTHGIYLSKPQLDMRIIEQVRQETNGIPIVMHGGSGVSNHDFQAVIRAGVRKINYFTYMDKAGGDAIAHYINQTTSGAPIFYTEASRAAAAGMKRNVMQAMKIFALLA